MLVRNFMASDVVTLSPDQTCHAALQELQGANVDAFVKRLWAMSNQVVLVNRRRWPGRAGVELYAGTLTWYDLGDTTGVGKVS